MTDDVEFRGCYARMAGDELVVGNAHVERRWQVRQGLLYATSIFDKHAGREWLARPAARPAPCPAWPIVPGERTVVLATKTGRFGAVERESLVVELVATGASDALRYRFQVFPEATGIVVQLMAERSVGWAPPTACVDEAAAGPVDPTGVELADTARAGEAADWLDVMEYIEPAGTHLRLTHVNLLDQTDIHNELVFEDQWLLHPNERQVRLSGNVFVLEDHLAGCGLIFLKLAPLPHARAHRCDWDLRVAGSSACFDGKEQFSRSHPQFPLAYQVTLAGHGAGGGVGDGYPCAILTYTGGNWGRIAALQQLQRQFRAYRPGRDGKFLSNTWGDRSRDAAICESFMLAEVESGAKLGVDVVQIDDGWQRGVTANSSIAGGVWNGFWAADANFWEPNTARFPSGIERVIGAARGHGMGFGLWFAPDSSGEFSNWRRDADKILEIHRKYGVHYIKIDGVKATTRRSEVNLRRFFDAVLEGSAGAIVFDLDVTAELRPGYFGLMHAGPIFVENRYTDYHRYWPHQTLRNLWKLAGWVDPQRLRIEFLNNIRKADVYVDDPLSPAAYSPEYLFATTMFANPLGWFEMSRLPESYFAGLPALVKVWKQHRDAIFGGTIYPIGAPPDGTSWTGFASVGPTGGYVLVFRELTRESETSIELPPLPAGSHRLQPLAGEGEIAIAGDRMQVRMPRPLGFLFAQIM